MTHSLSLQNLVVILTEDNIKFSESDHRLLAVSKKTGEFGYKSELKLVIEETDNGISGSVYGLGKDAKNLPPISAICIYKMRKEVYFNNAN